MFYLTHLHLLPSSKNLVSQEREYVIISKVSDATLMGRVRRKKCTIPNAIPNPGYAYLLQSCIMSNYPRARHTEMYLDSIQEIPTYSYDAPKLISSSGFVLIHKSERRAFRLKRRVSYPELLPSIAKIIIRFR